jgi:hypothetical protein
LRRVGQPCLNKPAIRTEQPAGVTAATKMNASSARSAHKSSLKQDCRRASDLRGRVGSVRLI